MVWVSADARAGEGEGTAMSRWHDNDTSHRWQGIAVRLFGGGRVNVNNERKERRRRRIDSGDSRLNLIFSFNRLEHRRPYFGQFK